MLAATAAVGLWPDSCCSVLMFMSWTYARPYTTGLVSSAVSLTSDAFASFSLLSLELMFIFEYSVCKLYSFNLLWFGCFACIRFSILISEITLITFEPLTVLRELLTKTGLWNSMTSLRRLDFVVA